MELDEAEEQPIRPTSRLTMWNRYHRTEVVLTKVRDMADRWEKALGDGCPDCGPVGYNGCDHIEGYNYALADLRDALSDSLAVPEQRTERVKAGMVLGQVSDGPHLHFETVDPQVEQLRRSLMEAEVERDMWKARHDTAIATCRYLHQEGLTREQWHLRHCAAMRSLQEANATILRCQNLLALWEARDGDQPHPGSSSSPQDRRALHVALYGDGGSDV